MKILWKAFLALIVIISVFSASIVNTVATFEVVAKIAVDNDIGNSPNGGVYDQNRGEIFLTNHESNTVSVISDSSNSVVATIPVGNSPCAIVFDSGKSELFVANYDSGTISVISDLDYKVVATVEVNCAPYDLLYDSSKGEVFVLGYNGRDLNLGADVLLVISDTDNRVVARLSMAPIPLGGPYGGGTIWNAGFNSMVCDSGKGEIFVANYYVGTISVISDSTNSIIASIQVQFNPYGLVYDSVRGEIFVVNDGSNSVSIISDKNNTVVATLPVGEQLSTQKHIGVEPYRIVYDSKAGKVFVSNPNSNTVSVLSDVYHTVVATVPVGRNPCALTYDSASNTVFVITSNVAPNSNVYGISDSSNSVTANVVLDFEGGPGRLILDSGKNELFATNSGNHDVRVLSESTNGVSSLSSTLLSILELIVIIVVVVAGLLVYHKKHKPT